MERQQNPQHALYRGHIIHHRSRPTRHRFRYGVFALHVQLDRLGDGIPGLLAINRPGLLSFQERDHGPGNRSGLLTWVLDRFASEGLATQNCTVTCLCYPRILGYVFNPLTVYYLLDRYGDLKAALLEVNNTFGERCTYVAAAGPAEKGSVAGDQKSLKASCRKEMVVSPFSPETGEYAFSITRPEEETRVIIRYEAGPDGAMKALFAGTRKPLSNTALLVALARYPLMTLKVVTAIHFEALRLFLKGTPTFLKRSTSDLQKKNPIAAKDPAQ